MAAGTDFFDDEHFTVRYANARGERVVSQHQYTEDEVLSKSLAMVTLGFRDVEIIDLRPALV